MHNRKLKIVTALLVGVALVLAFASLGLAQEAKVMKDSAKMMSDAWKMFDDGQRTVIKGVEMNNQVAAQGGFDSLIAPGNKVIQDGPNTVLQGAQLFAHGEKTVMNASDASVIKAGVEELRQGFKIAMGGKDMISQGVAMNDQVAQSKGAAGKFADGDNIIKTGMSTMADAVKLFMQGEALYLGTK
jgi:hypothetical protein